MGAKCADKQKLSLIDQIWTELPAVRLLWTHVPGGKKPTPDTITLPVYRYPTRDNLLFTLDFKAASASPSVFYERGVAVICTTQLG